MKNSSLKIWVLLLASALLLHGLEAQMPSFNWAISAGGISPDNTTDIVADPDGNIYLTGFFDTAVDFDPSSGSVILNTGNKKDIFVAKYDAVGALLWARGIGGDYDDQGYALTLDKQGNVLVTGSFTGVVDFDPGTGIDTLTSFPHLTMTKKIVLSPKPDVFILKLSTDGDYLWAKRIGAGGYDKGVAIAADQSNNVLITGEWMDLNRIPGNDTCDFDPGSGTFILKGGGCFVLKLDKNGNFIWAKTIGRNTSVSSVGGGGDWFYVSKGYSLISADLELKSLNAIVLAGNYYFITDADPGPDTSYLPSFGNDMATAIVSLDSNGNYLFSKGIGASVKFSGSSCYVSRLNLASDGKIHLGGFYVGTVDFDPSAGSASITSTGATGRSPKPDGYLLRLSDTGKYEWVRSFGGTGDDRVLDLKTDPANAIICVGSFEGKADFNPATGSKNVYNLTSKGVKDGFMCKLNSGGSFVFANQTGSAADDAVNALSLQSGDNIAIYTCGYFNGTADLNPTSGTQNATSAGSSDWFIQKFTISGSVPYEPEATTESNAALLVYPNPSSGLYYIQIPECEIVSIKLLNTAGRVIGEPIDLRSGLHKIDLTPFPDGVYFIEITGTAGIRNQQLLKIQK